MLNSFRNKIRIFSKRSKGFLILGVIALVLVLGILFIFRNGAGKIAGQSTVNIGKTYSVVARTKEKRLTDGEFKIKVTDAQFSDSILVRGNRATPVEGKIFLVLNMEIENSYRVPLYSFPVDNFRFVRTDGSKFAPSVHQGTVEVRPQSTKKSNVAFVVFPNERNFKIEVGEVGGETQTLQITF